MSLSIQGGYTFQSLCSFLLFQTSISLLPLKNSMTRNRGIEKFLISIAKSGLDYKSVQSFKLHWKICLENTDIYFITDFSIEEMRTLPETMLAENIPIKTFFLDTLITKHRNTPQDKCPLVFAGHHGGGHGDDHGGDHGGDQVFFLKRKESFTQCRLAEKCKCIPRHKSLSWRCLQK